MTLSDALQAISTELTRNAIHFCITGGFAYSVYAEPRATVDIDIVTLTADQREEIRKSLENVFPSVYENTAEFTYRLVILRRYLLIEEDREFVFDHLVVKEEYKEYGETLLSRVRSIPFGNTIIPLISLEDLIILKSASTRQQDRLDAGNLLAGADPGYLEEWTERLGVRLPE